MYLWPWAYDIDDAEPVEDFDLFVTEGE